jgi:cation:H+ antiporter
MTSVALLLVTLLGSFILLIWSADRLVIQAVGAAQRWRISPALIGMTVLALGTSLPEIMISSLAATTSRLNMAVANLQGSNIANLGLVLGLVLCFAPLQFKGRFEKTLPLLFGLSAILFGAMLWDLNITRIDGLLLLLAGLGWLFWMTRMAQRDRRQWSGPAPTGSSWILSLLIVLLLALVLISANALVWSASGLAEWLGLSERFIGLTLLAVGSSLPELVTTLAAARRAEHSLVLGNLAGSNIINLLLGGGLLALLGPGTVGLTTGLIDYSFMLALTLAVLGLWWYKGQYQSSLEQIWGLLLIACYTVFMLINYGYFA